MDEKLEKLKEKRYKIKELESKYQNSSKNKNKKIKSDYSSKFQLSARKKD